MLTTTDDEIQHAAQQIAATLGETYPGPVAQIERFVRLLGVEWAQTVLRETLAIEAQGGLILPDGRRRTVGGVFFYLARQRMTPEQAALVFPRTGQPQAPPVPREPMGWGQRLEAVREAGREKGKVMSVKIIVTGRPGSVVRREGTVVLTLEDNHEASLPVSVPAPPTEPTRYLVYVAARQWAAVEPAMQNPNDILIVQGTCSYDEEAKGIAVFAASVTTKLTKIQSQRRPGASGRKPRGAAPWAGHERDEARQPAPKPVNVVAPKPAPLPTKYKAGQRVQHPQFGAGIVLESTVIQNDEEVVVEFEVSGRRRLSTTATKLEVVE
jgi:PHAX RNA-binding domain-containing protein